LRILTILAGVILLAACNTSPAVFPTSTSLRTDNWGTQPAIQETRTVTATQPVEEVIPQPSEKFPQINPLTGLEVDPGILDRRPILVKIENLPRTSRPQWGLNSADIIYEYYTEEGTTRFAAIFYGEDTNQAAPIRSARWFDIQLVQMYHSIFVFGSAYSDLLNALFESDFKERLIIEQPDSCPALCRYDPRGHDYLMADTVELQTYIEKMGINNDRQNLAGLNFNPNLLPDGDKAAHVFIRFSGAIYNRWDYDLATGRYLRFSDVKDDIDHRAELYEPLYDRRTGLQVGTDNLVVILTDYVPLIITETSQVYDIPLMGTGWAYIFRDGQVYSADWVRDKSDGVLKFLYPDGTQFEFRPGKTWIEVLNRSSTWATEEESWRFEFKLP